MQTIDTVTIDDLIPSAANELVSADAIPASRFGSARQWWYVRATADGGSELVDGFN